MSTSHRSAQSFDLAGKEHDLKKAEHRADRAEQDAADAIDFALYAVDQVEWLVIDAALARADADDAAMVRN